MAGTFHTASMRVIDSKTYEWSRVSEALDPSKQARLRVPAWGGPGTAAA